MKASGPGTSVFDLREKPESTDHMEWLEGRVRAEGRQKWQLLIFCSLEPWLYISVKRPVPAPRRSYPFLSEDMLKITLWALGHCTLMKLKG